MASRDRAKEAMTSPSSQFERLCDSFCTRLSPDGLRLLQFFCEDVGLFSHQELQTLHTSLLLSQLNDFGIISKDNLQLFKYVARAGGQDEILEMVNQFEQNRPDQVGVLVPDSTRSDHRVPGYTAVNILVLDRVDDINRSRIESVCMSISDVSGIGYHEMAWLGYSEDADGMAVIMALVPKKCLPTLQSRVNQNEDRTLEEVGIVNVEMINLELKFEDVSARRPRSDAIGELWSPQVQALLRSISDGEVPSVTDVFDATGSVISEHVLDSLLEEAAKHSNAAAIDELVHIASRMSGRTGDTAVDILEARKIQIGLKLLPNAYIAGKEKLVRSLISHGFILHPAVESYTVLLTTVCQKKDYPLTLLKFLLKNEESIERPFQDGSKDDVYERCITYCCINGRDDLVALFLKRRARISPETIDRYSACFGRAMSRYGCRFRAVRTPRGLVRCVDICWQSYGLTQLYGDWLSKANLAAFLTRLDVSGNQLSSIPYSLLDGTLSRLEDLDCSGNRLKSLWCEDNDGPTNSKYKLRILNASRNELEELPLYLFQMPSLEILDVSRNMLASLPGPNVLTETISSGSGSSDATQRCWLCLWLKELDASHNCLVRLPETFGDVLHLRKLNLSYNKISILAQSLSKAPFLEQVDLSNNCLGAGGIDSNLNSLPKSILRLNVCGNNFGFMPRSLLCISALRRLDCASNCIGHLPYKQEWHLPHLQLLNLRGNKLGGTEGNIALPDSFEKSLTFLDLSHNELKKFPEAILSLKMIVCLILEGNPHINKLPPAVATLKRLWELRIDDMRKAVREIDPGFDPGTATVHYSKVKSIIRDSCYGYGLYCGVKLAVSGSEVSRNCVISGLRCHGGDADSCEELPMVSSLVFTSQSQTSVSSPQPRQFRWPKRLSKNSKMDATTATFKVWNVHDDCSFVVLQHVFFAENTVHLLVWHESDGLSGLDAIEDRFQLIRGSVRSVRTRLVTLTSKRPSPEVQERLGKLAKKLGHDPIAVDLTNRRRHVVPPLPDQVFSLAVELANVCENVMGDQNNKVPASFRLAARKLFASESKVSDVAVCSRKFIERQMFPGGFSDPDEFEQAMRFFMRIGALLHFEDTPRNLHEHFYLDMNVVSRVLVALTSDRSAHLSSGVAHARRIFALFSKFSVSESSDAMFALLIKLNALVPLDCCRCLLPFRLPSIKPGLNLTLSQYLSPADATSKSERSAPTYIRRLYSIAGFPPSFWGRFTSALVVQIQPILDSLETVGEHRAKTNAIFWASGILALYDEGCFIVNVVRHEDSRDYAGPLEEVKLCVESGLDVVVFDRRRQFAALGLICSHIERLLQEWKDSSGEDHYSPSSADVAVLSVERLVPYPPFDFSQEHSTDEILNDFIFEHVVPEKATLLKVEECAQAILEGSMQIDPTGTENFIDVSHLVPDLTLANLPPTELLNVEDVRIEITPSGNLGEGGFANVYLGYLGDKKVAYKIFADSVIPPMTDHVQLELKEDYFATRKRNSRRSGRRKIKAMKRVASLRQLKVLASFICSIGPTGVNEEDVKATSPPPRPQLDPAQCFKHLQDLVQEVAVMKQLQHKNIVKFKGVLFEPYPCLVMEFAPGGNLATLITKRRDEAATDRFSGVHFSGTAHDGIMGRELTHRIAFQIALGIEYLHSKAICHLDLKPENVLVWSESLTDSVNVKLTDYGISVTVPAVGVADARGTAGYKAPEQIVPRDSSSKSFDFRVDVFAYGMMMYYVLTGVHPFESDLDRPAVVEHKIRQNHRPHLPTGQSLVHLQTLIDRCWRYWPSERPSASEIVGEMCEPTFYLQCSDLVLNGSHKILATTSMKEDVELVRNDSVDLTVPIRPGTGTGISSRPRSRTCYQPLAKPRRLGFKRAWTSVPRQTSAPVFPTHVTSPVADSGVLSRSFSSEMISHFDEAKDRLSLRTTPPINEEIASERKSESRLDTDSEDTNSNDESGLSQPSSDDEDADEKPLSYELLITTDSLLVADPLVSRFLCTQPTRKLVSGDVSAMMFLNDRLWVGLRSRELRVFECAGGEIIRPIKRQSFSCNDVIEDIQCQFNAFHTRAKVFALLSNGQIVVINGHPHSNDPESPRLLNEWGRDAVYRWDQPEVKSVGKVGLEEEASDIRSCMVLVRPGELWYCQGNSITAVNTDKYPEEVIRIDGSITDSMNILDITIVREVAIVGSSVWCCDDTGSDTLCEIDIQSRTVRRSWKLGDFCSGTVERCQSRQSDDVPNNRQSLWHHVTAGKPQFVQCLAAVCDTLWIACNNGAILVVHKDSEDSVRLLATLWCLPGIGQKLGELPIAKMRQVGDRVLVYHKTNADNSKRAEQMVVAEVFQAVNSSQLKKLVLHFSIQDA